MTERDHDDSEAVFVARVREALDRQPLPPGIPQRLVAARRAAVDSVQPARRVPAVPSRWVPVGALASTVLAVGVAMVSMESARLPIVEDERAFVAAQDVELLEDLEFLAWLDDGTHAS